MCDLRRSPHLIFSFSSSLPASSFGDNEDSTTVPPPKAHSQFPYMQSDTSRHTCRTRSLGSRRPDDHRLDKSKFCSPVAKIHNFELHNSEWLRVKKYKEGSLMKFCDKKNLACIIW